MLYEDCQPSGPRTATYEVLSALVGVSSTSFTHRLSFPLFFSLSLSFHLQGSSSSNFFLEGISHFFNRNFSRAARRDNLPREGVMTHRVDFIALTDSYI